MARAARPCCATSTSTSSPLAPGSRFNEAKSAIKWLEAALVATPTVASPTEPFREAMAEPGSGCLADDHDEWVDGPRPAARATRPPGPASARVARRRALLEWAPALQGQRYRAILEAMIGRRPAPAGRPAPSTWAPVALDEPAMPYVLEPYPGSADEADDGRSRPVPVIAPDDEPTRLVRLVARLDSLTRRGLASVRTDGAKVTGAKAAAKVRNRLQR